MLNMVNLFAKAQAPGLCRNDWARRCQSEKFYMDRMIMTAIFVARVFVVHAHLRMGADDLRAFSVAADGNAAQLTSMKNLRVRIAL